MSDGTPTTIRIIPREQDRQERLDREVMCIYCGASNQVLHQDPAHMEEPCELIPAVDDDSAWDELAMLHSDTCEWIRTRAHQRPVGR